ncbi:MAG: penicillin-binding protein [Fusobacteriaceae bacterium]|jgi:penicillin-binding protein 1A|nr:penicillin-binding protein [Fusobacteriaceae bacterium]
MKKKSGGILLKFICLCLLSGAAVAGAGVFFLLDRYYKELPDIAELIENYTPSLPSMIYDRKGELIDTLYVETRDVIRIHEVPELTKNAFLSIEDKSFYAHHGVHIKRNIGAVVANMRAGRTVQGASSITQQLAKNAFLTQEKTMDRKIKEAIITFEIERRYTKEEIFEKYLNEVNFGSGLYGIKTASRQYFKKEVPELDIAESALLAAIPNRPERYNPRRHLDEAVKRARLIVQEMYADGRISAAQRDEALSREFINEDSLPAELVDPRWVTTVYNKEGGNSINYPDFTNMVTDFLTTIFPEQLVMSGGLKIRTTMDRQFQELAKASFDSYSLFKQRPYLNGGMVTIDPNTGYVISMVGGRNFQSGNFNRATMARRQVGSSFKPFLYFTAILNGYETTTVIEDSFFSQGKWTPKNFGGNYSDNITLQNALDRSLNVVSIKILKQLGIETFQNLVKKVNPQIRIPGDLTGALGSFEATPLQMAIAYSIFSNGGYVVKPVSVLSVEDRNGNILYQQDIHKEKTFDSIDTSVVTSMLVSSVRRGSSARAAVTTKEGKTIAQGGKTGTTNENRTVWYVGITPEYITAIYVGRDDNKPVPGITGGTGSAPLWNAYYKKIIDSGLYLPGEFVYLDNHLKNGELYMQNIDPVNGFASGGGRPYVVRSQGIQVEKEGKYSGGIAGVLGIAIQGGLAFGEVEGQENTAKSDNLVDDILRR